MQDTALMLHKVEALAQVGVSEGEESEVRRRMQRSLCSPHSLR